MKAILKKEWKSYFNSPIGYIFVGVFLALCAMFFVSGSLIYQSADLKSMFANVNVVYLFLVSILTMGLFSLERSRRTDQLLLTAPVSVWDIVTGKYLAAMSVFGVTLLISLIFPIVLVIFGAPNISEIIGAYIGFILLWGAFIAIGMFISTLTESQMISAVITFGVLLLVFYIDFILANVNSGLIQKFIGWFSLMRRYTDFQNGILNIVNVIYYLTFIGVFIFLSGQVIYRRQHSDKKSQINSSVFTIIVIVGAMLLNGIVGTIGGKMPLKIDLTKDKVYQFSAQTKEVMDELNKEVTVYALYPDSLEGELVSAVKEYLNKYESMSDKLTVTYVDPYQDPAFARRYGENAGVGTVVVEHGDNFRVIPLEQLYIQGQSGEVAIDLEKQMTNAISYVTGTGQTIKVYMVEGHNEYAGQELIDALKSEGYETGSLNLASSEIPEDASILVSMAPSVDFTAEERDALDKYLSDGGKAMFMLTAGNPELNRLGEYLKEWGIEPNYDFAYENDGSRSIRSSYGVPIPAPELSEHKITEKISGSDIPYIAPRASSFTLNENNIQHTYVTALLKTSKDSWGIKDLARETTDKEEGDISGPLVLSAISEQSGGKRGAIMVHGSLDAIEGEGIIDDASYSNGDFIMNSFAYLTGKGDVMNIRAKIISAEKLTMTETQVRVLSIVLQYVLPLIILLAGLIMWIRRRHL